MMHRRSLLLSFLLAVVQAVWSWEGSGTETDPYLINNDTDWDVLASETRMGTPTEGKVYRLTADVRAGSITVGTDENPFCGTLDGDGHVLRITFGASGSYHSKLSAPLAYVSGATVRNLRTEGSIQTSHQYASGLVGLVKGTAVTHILNCHSSADIDSEVPGGNDAAGGLVGAVASGGLEITSCSFTGGIRAAVAAGMVGWSNVAVKLSDCMVNPTQRFPVNSGENFVRMAGGVTASLTDCFYTIPVAGSTQGEGALRTLHVPEGCTSRFVSEPDLQFNGVNYWRTGTWVEITVPEGMPFDHWETAQGGLFISDPWTAGGLHQLRDIHYGYEPLKAATQMPAARLEREMDGTRYRYLTRRDYHLYLSDEECRQRGYVFEGSDPDAYLIKKVDGATCYITAVVGWKQGSIPADGLQIHNDISGVWHDYTLMGCIAPRAFKGCQDLKTVYFKDTDANNYNAQENFCFSIGEEAFADCPNLTEVKLMQYTTKGDNHWEMIRPEQIPYIAPSAFDRSPKAEVSCHREVYQQYLTAPLWLPMQGRIIVYDATVTDFTIDGVKYHTYRNKTEDKELTNGNKDAMLDNHIRVWNADYQDFNAADLLETNDNAETRYTSVVGIDDDDIDGEDGKVVILNDLGTYHNYKNICLTRNALAGNDHVKSIEFRQVNGDQTSRSDLKMVIQNGALARCKNLKEIRMFYWCEDGQDHWEALGPENVIPGNNIFGLPSPDELNAMSEEEQDEYYDVLSNVRILVSTTRFTDFLEDPNWIQYSSLFEAVEYDPQNQKKDFTIGDQKGITYGYVSTPGGLLQTSQTVSQDVSWWTAPRIAIEVALDILTMGTWSGAQGNAAGDVVEEVVENVSPEVAAAQALSKKHDNLETLFQLTNAFRKNEPVGGQIAEMVGGKNITDMGIALKETTLEKDFSLFSHLRSLSEKGLYNMETGAFASKEQFLMAFSESKGSSCVINVGGVAAKGKYFVHQSLKQAEQKAFGEVGYLASQKQLAKEVMINNVAEKIKFNFDFAFDKIGTRIYRGVNTSALIATQCWGDSGSYDGDKLRKGMRENILSNIHQLGMVGGGYIITTPQKNIVYHTYIKDVADDVKDAVIYAGTDRGQGANHNASTTTFARNAFRGKKNLETVSFFETDVTTNEAIPMLLTIPDSAFVGCDNLRELNLILNTDGNGTRALGPENFILAGDSIFAGLSPETFHIVIDKTRKLDFLMNESWAPLERFFRYGEARAESRFNEFGVKYAYSYENGTTQRVHKVNGHKIEHTIVSGTDDTVLTRNGGVAALFNDIGEWNNYQLDAVASYAFKGNGAVRRVQFGDLIDNGPYGECYTGLEVMLEDSCFADCGNLQSIDLIYCVNDQPNVMSQLMSMKFEGDHVVPMTPQMVKAGRGILFNSPGRLKMMPQQVSWFEADSSWVEYKEKFMPCVFMPSDQAVWSVLKDLGLRYRLREGVKEHYYDFADLSYLPYKGYGEYDFSPLRGRFTDVKDKLRSFPEFRYFSCLGMKVVPSGLFEDCHELTSILLPETAYMIDQRAFKGCTSLREIDLPESVVFVEADAFAGDKNLNTIRIRHRDVAIDIDGLPFDIHDGLRIVVPDDMVQKYKEKASWQAYAPYICGESDCPTVKRVTVTAPGQLAQQLGLGVRMDNSKVRWLDGNYALYDSLTVSGPLNGVDLGVLRYLAGADAYDSEATGGQLRYLDLWDATLKRDDETPYNGNGLDEYTREDNYVGDYLFENCTALETVILPKRATHIGENVFEDATSLRRVCVGRSTETYGSDLLQNLDGIQELVFVTDAYARTDYSDAWEAAIGTVFAPQSQVGRYMSNSSIARRAQAVYSPFQDDAVMMSLAEHGAYFPTEYLERESVEGLLSGAGDIVSLDDFWRFRRVSALSHTFGGCVSMESVAIPASVRHIGRDAFAECYALTTVRVSASLPATIDDGVFRYPLSQHPDKFRILVPKRLCKLYRQSWPEYAEYINPDMDVYDDGQLVTVTVDAPNQLAQALGLKVSSSGWPLHIDGLRGDYHHITKLKVIGPISGHDFDVLKYLAGYIPWARDVNWLGRLEYLDLYDARVVKSTATQGTTSGVMGNLWTEWTEWNAADDELTRHAFLKARSLRTLILPRTVKHVAERSLQECENLEVLVLGDDVESMNWNALDDDASLSRMYILGKDKLRLSGSWRGLWDLLCNNYNPTFDAFYVRPSLLADYRSDAAFAGTSAQRTNSIVSGIFDTDEEFCAFASHGAATTDDLAAVVSVDGWFRNHTAIRDLTALRYTSVQRLRRQDIQPLTRLERVALPPSLDTIEEGTFSNAIGLHWADFLLCDAGLVESDLAPSVKDRLGISAAALVYLPSSYGESDDANVVVDNGRGLYTPQYNLNAGWDYDVPYAFTARRTRLSRQLAARSAQTLCLPYDQAPIYDAKAYELSARDGNTLVFRQVSGTLQALHPYLVVSQSRGYVISDGQTHVPASGATVHGGQTHVPGMVLRGTLGFVPNSAAADMGALVIDGNNQKWKTVSRSLRSTAVKPFSAYLLPQGQIGEVTTTLVDDTGVATDIDTLCAVDQDGTQRYYDLQGRELPARPAHGIYIQGGEKHLAK